MNTCKKCCGSIFKTTQVTTAEIQVTMENGCLVPSTEPGKVINTEYSGSVACVSCGAVNPNIEDIDDSEHPGTRRCTCGNSMFYANQLCYHDVIVNSDNIFERNIEISEAESPYGTYCCTKCGAEYENLSELDKLTTPCGGKESL